MKEKNETKWFDDYANSPGAWLNTGNELYHTAEFLNKRAEFNVFANGLSTQKIVKVISPRVVFMIRGMAMECFLKAVLVKRKKIQATDGKLINSNNGYNNHDLLLLAKDIPELSLDKLEKNILSALSISIIGGRFPVLKNHQKKSGFGWVYPQDEDLYNNIVSKLSNLFETN